MQPLSRLFRRRPLPLANLLLSLAPLATAAAQAPATSNAAPAEPEPPKSVFRIPSSPNEGRDPFFPQSAFRKPEVVRAAPSAPPAVAELELKGISGSPERRLAIINNRTFELGEEGTVLSNVGRVRLTCKDIGTNSVRVSINGQDRVLTLRPR